MSWAPPTSITIDDKTKVRGRARRRSPTSLVGDRVLVQAKVCKADLKDPTAMPALTARMVVAHPAKADKDDAENDD